MKKKITLNQVKKFLLKKGLIVTEKNRKLFLKNDLKSIYFTVLSSLVLILFFYSLPIFFEFKKNSINSSIEITNNSKSNFEKVLDGEALEKLGKVDEGLDLKNLFEDVFKLDDLPSDTVRLSAATIEQLFKDTNYTLKDVRITKLVKPIAL